MLDVTVVGLVALVIIAIIGGSSLSAMRGMQRTIDRQNDTINRLINREPVTYAEVGQAPQKPSKEVYAAWGAQMVDLDKDEPHS